MATQIAPGALVSESNAGVGFYQRFFGSLPWWALPLTVVSVLGGFTIYAVWTAFFSGGVNQSGPYLSPFYSPLIWATGPISPALWVLWSPLAFRATCYYYRKAYYRSFWLSPPACGVPDAHEKYTGETRFPLLGQNLHRYAFYAAVLISLINTYDAVLAMHSAQGFGLGLGNVVLWGNVVLLWAYTLSCHSCRHIVGGKLKHFSKHPVRYKAWQFVGKLNNRHMQLAWASLISVAAADFYVYLVASGAFNDPRFF